MTETVSDAPPAAAGKRRGRPESRQRPQSRNPSAPMKPPEPATEPAPEPAQATAPEPEPAPESASASAQASASEPAPEPQPVKGSGPPNEPEPSTEPDPSPDPSAEPEPESAPESAPGSEPAQSEAPGERTAHRGRLRRVVRSGAGLPRKAWRAMPRPARRPAAERTPRFRPVLRAVLHGLNPRRLPLRRIPLPRWWPAALCVLVGVLAGLAYGLLRPAQFTATSYVAVVPGEEGDPMTALGFAQAYGRIATDTAVLAGAQQEAGVPVATLKSSVEAVTSPDAPMIEITGTAPRAGEAADIANAVARSLTKVSGESAQATGVELTAFSRARAPRESSTPSPVLTTAVGGSAGVLVGALVLVVRPRREDEAPAAPAAPVPAAEEPADRVTPQQSRTPKKQTGPRAKRSPARERRNSGGRTREKEAVR